MRRSPSPFPPRECEIEAAAAAAMAINLTKDVALGPLPPPTERGTDPPSPSVRRSRILRTYTERPRCS